jgi:uncharacterized protein (TIGR00266 family)
MDHSINHGPVFTTLALKLLPGERFKAEAGAMVAMSPTIDLQAKASGKGLLGTIAAAVGGEALFGSIFTAREAGELILAPGVPGDIFAVELKGQTLFAQGGAYLAGSVDLTLSTQGSLRAMIGGEGLFLSKISGTGLLFLNCYGAVFTKTLLPGESYIVDTGHIVAFEAGVEYRLRKAAPGLFNTLASGEGLVAEFTGPGKLWIQSRNLKAFAGILAPFLGRISG